MNVVSVLLDILVVLVAAKLAAEIAERIKIPAVVGEIVAGIVVGPSVLGLVGSGDVLRTLGELGVVLLLLEVGMEMDLGELGKVGRTSLFVASIGVVAPLVLGFAAMSAIGFGTNEALFVAAALTATSVGITARVFGDLRALATTEARVVLGAAVADDVMGLVVLTVVVRVVTEGSVAAIDVVQILLVAVAFLLFGGLLAIWIAPRLFDLIERRARSAGTIVALALAFTLAFAELADAAQLAVVVGAFLAGLALGRTVQSERIRRELAPVGHLFIPVFFLQIGIDVDVSSFGQLTVLRDAAILLVVAVVGKLVASAGTAGTPSDKLLVGLGMLPRGEVGLIFATIGLSSGVLGNDLYAALLLVVLATTLVTPVLLRRRYDHLAGRSAAAHDEPVTRRFPPPGGWIQIEGGEIALAARPERALSAEIALEAARYVASARPSAGLLDWFATNRNDSLPWSERATKAFIDLLSTGTARSWRFLDALDVLPRIFPELADALQDRRENAFELDPMRLHRWETLELLAQLRTSGEGRSEWGALVFPERVLIAAFLIDVVGGRPEAMAATRQFVERLGLGNAAEHEIATLVRDPDLLLEFAHRNDGLDEEPVLQLAVHLRGPETARAAFLVASARQGLDLFGRSRMAELHALVQRVFADPHVGPEAENLVARNRADAARLVSSAGARARIEDAPREYVVAQTPAVIARHAELLARWRGRGSRGIVVSRTQAEPPDTGWWLDCVTSDRHGLLARVASVLPSEGLDVQRAIAVTWPHGPALESFLVTRAAAPHPALLQAAIESAADAPLHTGAVVGAEVRFDDSASPWYTTCEVRAPDAPGLLAAVAAAFAAAKVDVHRAYVETESDAALDRFELTSRGHRLTPAARTEVRNHIAHGVELPRRRRLPGRVADRGKAALGSIMRHSSTDALSRTGF